MPRSLVAGLAGIVIAQVVVATRLNPDLRGSAELRAALAQSPAATRYSLGALRWGLRGGVPLLLVALVALLEEHRLLPGPRRPRARPMPPAPPTGETQLVLAPEVHNPDGSRCERPTNLVIPEAGMWGSILCTGATRTGKTSGVLLPIARQLIRMHADDPERRFAGMFIDPKGNLGPDIFRECVAAGREADFYHIQMPDCRMNVLRRPDLHPIALAGHVDQVFENAQAHARSDPFWARAARELAGQTLRLISLAERRPPAMDDLYRYSSSPKAFNVLLRAAHDRRGDMNAEELAELESLDWWYKYTFEPLDDRTRTNIAVNLSGLCSLFDAPDIKRCFCPRPEEETFLGFERILEEGRIVVLSVPEQTLKHVAVVVGTMAKLNYMDAVSARYTRAHGSNATVGRGCFLLADEYDLFITPGDGIWLARAGEARALTCFAVQSWTSLGTRLRDKFALDQLLAQFRTHVWLALNDAWTAEEAAKLCGRIDRVRPSRTVTEHAQRAAFSFVDRKRITEGGAGASASVSWTIQEEYLFPPTAFLYLKTFQAVVRAFDGHKVLPPTVAYLKRIDQVDDLRSWFDVYEEGD